LSDWNNFPAVIVRALSASSLIGKEYFALGFVPQGVQEWNDTNGDGKVELTELIGTPHLFNDASYSWSFSSSSGNNLYTLSMIGTSSASNNPPTLEIDCSISARDTGTVVGGFNVTGSVAKCNITITGMVLQGKTNGWAFRSFIVGKTQNIFLIGKNSASMVSGGVAGEGVDVGGGGNIWWNAHAGTALGGGRSLTVSFSGFTGAAAFAGKSFYQAVEANFGFVNPNPGSDFGIFWDPALGAPGVSAACIAGPAAIVFSLLPLVVLTTMV